MASFAERVERLRKKYEVANESFEADLVALTAASHNYATALQNVADTTRVLIAGSNLVVPGFNVGSRFRWRFNMTKTAAGTASSVFDICVGKTASAAGLTAQVAFTKPAGTAAVDEAVIEIVATCRSVGASGVVVGEFSLIHNLAATGHAQIPAVCVSTISAGFANNLPDVIVGVCVTAGASDDLTFQLVQAEAVLV